MNLELNDHDIAAIVEAARLDDPLREALLLGHFDVDDFDEALRVAESLAAHGSVELDDGTVIVRDLR